MGIIGTFVDLLSSRMTDKDIDSLQEGVMALNYELTMLRYKESEDEDIRLAYEFMKKRPFCTTMFPYEQLHEIPPFEVFFDKDRKMHYVKHGEHPLYFPKKVSERLVRNLYRYAIEYDDIAGNGYRQRCPHAFQSERYHIEAGDVLIDAGGRTFIEKMKASTIQVLDEALGVMIDKVTDSVKYTVSREHSERPRYDNKDVTIDVGSPRGLLALDVIDKVSKVYLVETSSGWWKPLEATFAPFKDKVELIKGDLSNKQKEEKKKSKKKESIPLADLLERCGQKRVFVMMDLEGDELDVLRDAQEYLRTARSPIILAVCAYHRTTDYDDLVRFFEAIGYHTETQPGYIYTEMNDGHGLRTLRRGLIRAANF